jgi:transcriptional regulator with XRE-family HTH domain
MDWRRLACKAREIRGITQEEFAVLLNTTQTSISRWERGATQPSGQARATIHEIVLGSHAKILPITDAFLEFVENSLNPMGVLDENGNTLALSFGACELMGISQGMALGRHFNELNKYSVFASSTTMDAMKDLRGGKNKQISTLVDFDETQTSVGIKALQWGYTHGFYSAVPVLLNNIEIGIFVSMRLMTEQEALFRGGTKSWDAIKVKSLSEGSERN